MTTEILQKAKKLQKETEAVNFRLDQIERIHEEEDIRLSKSPYHLGCSESPDIVIVEHDLKRAILALIKGHDEQKKKLLEKEFKDL